MMAFVDRGQAYTPDKIKSMKEGWRVEVDCASKVCIGIAVTGLLDDGGRSGGIDAAEFWS